MNGPARFYSRSELALLQEFPDSHSEFVVTNRLSNNDRYPELKS